jgi:hypothetical protein
LASPVLDMAVMSVPASRFATSEDLLALPDTVVGEILGGQVITSPRPSGRHAYAATGLTISIGSSFHFDDGGPGGWTILTEPELYLDTDPRNANTRGLRARCGALGVTRESRG